MFYRPKNRVSTFKVIKVFLDKYAFKPFKQANRRCLYL